MALERFDPCSKDWGSVSADHLARYLFASAYANGKRLVDAGTGYGYGATILAMSGAREVIAFDIDPEVVQQARERYQTPNLKFLVDDCQILGSVFGQVDVICNFENIEHLLDPLRFIHASSSILDPEGVLICSTPDKASTPPFRDGRPANPYHVNEWYAEEFVSLLQQGYAEVALYSQVRAWTLIQKEMAVNQLEAFLEVQPALRIGRWLSSIFGRGGYTPDLAGLRVAGPLEYPIFPSAVARLFGSPFCHLAVCRRPRKSNLSSA